MGLLFGTRGGADTPEMADAELALFLIVSAYWALRRTHSKVSLCSPRSPVGANAASDMLFSPSMGCMPAAKSSGGMTVAFTCVRASQGFSPPHIFLQGAQRLHQLMVSHDLTRPMGSGPAPQ